MRPTNPSAERGFSLILALFLLCVMAVLVTGGILAMQFHDDHHDTRSRNERVEPPAREGLSEAVSWFQVQAEEASANAARPVVHASPRSLSMADGVRYLLVAPTVFSYGTFRMFIPMMPELPAGVLRHVALD